MPSPRQSEGSAQRKNVTIACQTCRKRKSRCDGALPSCSLCRARQIECDYSSSTDRRSRAYSSQRISRDPNRITSGSPDDASYNEVPLVAASSSAGSRSSNVANQPMHVSTQSPGLSQATSTSPSRYYAADSLQMDQESGSLTFLGPTAIPRQRADIPGHSPHLKWLPTPSVRQFELNGQMNPIVTDELVDLFFAFCNGFYAFLDETTFRNGLVQYNRSAGTFSKPVVGFSPFLYYSVLAIAAHVTNRYDSQAGTSNDAASKGSFYLQSALSLLDAEVDNARPTTVTALVLIIPVVADLGKNSMAWLYGGMALRISEGLGLHIDATPLLQRGQMDLEGISERQHAFWSIYCQDKLLALYLGRAPSLSQTDYDISLPQYDLGNHSLRIPSLTDLERAFVTLADLWGRMHKHLFGLKSHKSHNTHSEETGLRQALDEWLVNLPPFLQSPELRPISSPPLIMIHAMHTTMVNLFLRSRLQRRCLDHPDGHILLESAIKSTKLARYFDLAYTIRKAPVTMTQILFVAGSVLILIIADLYDQADQAPARDRATAALDESFGLLDRLANSWSLTRHALDTLQTIRNECAVFTQQNNVATTFDWSNFALGDDFNIDTDLIQQMLLGLQDSSQNVSNIFQ